MRIHRELPGRVFGMEGAHRKKKQAREQFYLAVVVAEAGDELAAKFRNERAALTGGDGVVDSRAALLEGKEAVDQEIIAVLGRVLEFGQIIFLIPVNPNALFAKAAARQWRRRRSSEGPGLMRQRRKS